jgi:pimeloyl-ACP methyl ester carboxylesterase
VTEVAEAPTAFVTAGDGTAIAVFRTVDLADAGGGLARPPLLLVHGAAADHTTWRVSGPLLARHRAVWSMDRRGRGASGDGSAYEVGREYDDVAAVAEWIAANLGGETAVDVVGHSFGGRVALGAALRTRAIRRVVSYEGAPAPAGASYHDRELEDQLRGHLLLGRNEAALVAFLRAVVGMQDADIEAYRANPVWPDRVAAAPTILRELEAERSAAASIEALRGVRVPVLQVLGGASLPVFGAATRALDERLEGGRVVVIDGARHAAHHTHASRFVAAVEAFLGEP